MTRHVRNEIFYLEVGPRDFSPPETGLGGNGFGSCEGCRAIRIGGALSPTIACTALVDLGAESFAMAMFPTH